MPDGRHCYHHVAAVSCSDGPVLGGVKSGLGLTGKLGRAWVGTWVGAWVGAWVMLLVWWWWWW